MSVMNKSDLIEIKYTTIRKVALIYVTLPLLCFFLGWLKPYFAIPAFICLIFCLFLAFKSDKKEEKENNSILISKYFIIFLALCSFIYCFLSGIGRLWAQSKDYPWRNAIFRDIILRASPVKYPNYDRDLVYYIGLWLPPSLLGKLSLFFGANDELAFKIGNIALLIYSSFGLFILFFTTFIIAY